MAQYCELAGKVINCTGNCKVCLGGIEVGDKVRYITEDTAEAKETGYFPPKGTIGTVIGIDLIFTAAPYLIRWPKGTTKPDGCWYVSKEDIELV